MKFTIRVLASRVDTAHLAGAGLAFVAALGLGNAVAASDAASPSTEASTTSPTPTINYKSPFTDYRALGEDRRISWKAANDEVAKIGGWRVYAREAAESGSAAAPLLAPVPATAPPPDRESALTPPAAGKAKPMPMNMPMPSGHGDHGKLSQPK